MSSLPRLLIDLSSAYNQGAGIGRYARMVVGAATPALTGRMDVSGWYASDGGFDSVLDAETILGNLGEVTRRSRLSRRRVDQLWFRLPLGVTARGLVPPAEVIYSPDFTVPPVGGVDRIVTVHDLAYLRSPETCPEPLRRYLTSVVPRQIASARMVIAVSETTRREVQLEYGVADDRIVVIPNAADDRFFAAVPPSPRRRAELGLPDRYVLTVGTLEPRKNHLMIFAAMERVHAEIGVPLVVVGRGGWDNLAIRRRLAELTERGVTIPMTNLIDRHLPEVYAGAAAVVQLSWYEGFGIPVVEALAAGAPVVASNIAAHREVAGGMAELVDPRDPVVVADAVVAAVAARSNQVRGQRKAAAAAFSWGRSGTMLADLLIEVSHGRRPG